MLTASYDLAEPHESHHGLAKSNTPAQAYARRWSPVLDGNCNSFKGRKDTFDWFNARKNLVLVGQLGTG